MQKTEAFIEQEFFYRNNKNQNYLKSHSIFLEWDFSIYVKKLFLKVVSLNFLAFFSFTNN